MSHTEQLLTVIVIPATIESKGKTYSVTSIGEDAFYDYSRIQTFIAAPILLDSLFTPHPRSLSPKTLQESALMVSEPNSAENVLANHHQQTY